MNRRTGMWVGLGVCATLTALVVGDRAADVVVQRVVAGKIQDCLHTPEAPSVDIKGFPLLPDLLRRRLDDVSMTARDVDAGGVRVGELGARLRGVRQSGDTAQVRSLDGAGLVTYDALSAVAPGVAVSYGGDGLLQVKVGVSLLSATATARPRFEGDKVVIAPERLESLLGSLDLGSMDPITYQLRDIPAGVNVRMDPTERGVEFAFDGRNVSFPTNGGCPKLV